MGKRAGFTLAALLTIALPYIALMHSSLSSSSQLFFSNLVSDAPILMTSKSQQPCDTPCACFVKELALRSDAPMMSHSSAWNLFRYEILNATFRRMEADDDRLWNDYREWIEYLFSESSPQLVRSVQPGSFPSREILQSIQAIIHKRRPLQVVVLGGSLTAGHGCRQNPIGLSADGGILKRQVHCAWPSRLESLVNALAGFELVNITNLAMAATTSDVGSVVVEYDLWPESLVEKGGPDVIISAFATNDALSILSGDASSRQEVFDKMQSLFMQVQKQQFCSTKLPLLMVVNDFNLWPGNLSDWLAFHQDLSTLVDWYHPNAWLIDYAKPFSEYVYADWKDTNVKGKWEWKPQRQNYAADAHPGMAFHITMAWTIAYNMLALAMETCSTLAQELQVSNKDFSSRKFALPSIPRGPKPLLAPGLRSEDVADLWKKETEKHKANCDDSTGTKNRLQNCACAWIANRLSDCPDAPSIQAKLDNLLLHNNGWRAEGNSYRSKHGWVAQKPNASFEIMLPNVTVDVSILNIFSMVSYGDKWEDSLLRVNVRTGDDSKPSSAFDISGIHNATTSVILPHRFELSNPVRRGESIRIDFRLAGGSTFKITGMAFCGS